MTIFDEMNTDDAPAGKAIIPPAIPKSAPSRLLRRVRVPLTLVVAVLAWQIIAESLDTSVYLVPTPTVVWDRFLEAPDAVLDAFVATLIESAIGFAAAAVVGVLLAIIIARSQLMEEVLYPYLNIVRITPIVAVAPLMAIWFGHGLTPTVIVAALIAFFPIVVTMVLGLKSVDRDLINLMSILNSHEAVVLWKIRLPNSMPYLFSSFRIAAPLAVVGALVGEFVGGTEGLGYLLVLAQGRIDTPMVFVAVVFSCILGLGAFGLVVIAERRFVRWHPSTRLHG